MEPNRDKLIRSFTYIKPTEPHYNQITIDNDTIIIGRREKNRYDIEIKYFNLNETISIISFIFGFYKIGSET
jgi:hypothetical protein